jgi:hypothetical protein
LARVAEALMPMLRRRVDIDACRPGRSIKEKALASQ